MAETGGPTYTQLIPFAELAPGQAAAIRNETIRKMLQLASVTFKLPPSKLVVRDIRPAGDLDFGTEDWGEVTGATSGAYETMSTGTMATDRFVGIFGVKDNSESPSVSALRFTIGGGERAIWILQDLNSEDGKVAFTPFAVIIPQQTIYTIARYVVSINSTSVIVLKGVVVEPRGKVVSP